MLETGHRRAQNRLCTLLGMPPRNMEAELGPPGTIPLAPPELAVGIPAELLRRRPDVRRAEREAAAQCAQIGMAESELDPQIAITGTIAFEAEDFGHLFDWHSANASADAAALAHLQYQQGLIDFQRVLDSQRALVLQQDTLAESRGNVSLNLIAVYKALGGGWQMCCVPGPEAVEDNQPGMPSPDTF